GFQAGGAEIHHRVRDGGRQVAVFALRRPSGRPGGRRRTSRRNHGHDLRPAGPLSVVRQRQPRENRPPGHRCALPPGRASGQLQVGIPRHPDRRPDGGAGGVSGQLEDLKRGAAPFLPEPEFLFKAGLPTFVGSPFLFDAMGARRRMRPPILSFPRCRIFWNACGIIYSVVESGGKWGEGETAGCSWGNTGIPWTIRVVCSSLPNSGRDWVPPLSSPAVWTAVSSHIPARNGLSSNRN